MTDVGEQICDHLEITDDHCTKPIELCLSNFDICLPKKNYDWLPINAVI